MPHERIRSVGPIFYKLLAASPIIGIFGHRQVGKTTWLSKSVDEYKTLDSEETLEQAQSNATSFLQSFKLKHCGIDECQMSPSLFPALKEYCRKNPKPGKWILSGSVRFSSRKAIRESLAGRMLFFEMLPLVLNEFDSRPLPDIFINLLKKTLFDSHTFVQINVTDAKSRLQTIEKYLNLGGLPGICFLREPQLRIQKLKDLHDLILDRDLRLVHQTNLPLSTLKKFYQSVLQSPWEAYNFTKVRKETGIAVNTQKHLLYALESIFLIRRIPIYGGKKGDLFFAEDQLEENILSYSDLTKEQSITSLLYRNIRAQFFYRIGSPVTILSYQTRGGAIVPIVFKTQESSLGVITIEGNEPSLSQIRSAESFIKNDPTGKIIFVTHSKYHPPKIMLAGRFAIVSIIDLV